MGVLVLVAVVLVVLAGLAAAAMLVLPRLRTRRLREQFGPEYDEVLAGSTDRKEAESTLATRRDRHASLDLRPLEHGERDRFAVDWTQVQRGFVDDPGGAVAHADTLVTTIMRRRGYPADDFEQRAADVSVAHPRAVQHYRAAHQVGDAHHYGDATTEDLRRAVTSYRSLVEALLADTPDRERTDPLEGRGITGDEHHESPGADRGRRDGSRS